MPYPPNRGDRIRSFHLLKHLATNANVWLAALSDEPVSRETLAELGKWCERVSVEPVGRSRWLRAVASLCTGRSATEGLFHSPRLRRTIETWTRERAFDFVVVFCSSMVQYLDLTELRDVPAVVDLVDVDSQKFADYAFGAGPPRKWLYELEARRLRRVECKLPSCVRAVSLVSEAEADLYRRICPNDRTVAVSNGVDLEYFQPAGSDGRPGRFVFVGAMDYQPNADGVVWFCSQVWPQLRADIPDATFAIVGRKPTPAVRRLANQPGVEVTGSVPDVRPFVEGAQVVVAPLRIARGIQNKILEAMAMQKPVIATPQALEGLAAEPGVHALAASSVTEWLQQMRMLTSSPALRAQLAQRARAMVERRYGWKQCLASFPWPASTGDYDAATENSDRPAFDNPQAPVRTMAIR